MSILERQAEASEASGANESPRVPGTSEKPRVPGVSNASDSPRVPGASEEPGTSNASSLVQAGFASEHLYLTLDEESGEIDRWEVKEDEKGNLSLRRERNGQWMEVSLDGNLNCRIHGRDARGIIGLKIEYGRVFEILECLLVLDHHDRTTGERGLMGGLSVITGLKKLLHGSDTRRYG
jgi:hypothetical protein